MKKLIMSVAAFVFAASVMGAENLVQNGTFEQLVAGKPAAWIVKNTTGITFSGDGAPESGFVKFDLVKDGKKANNKI